MDHLSLAGVEVPSGLLPVRLNIRGAGGFDDAEERGVCSLESSVAGLYTGPL